MGRGVREKIFSMFVLFAEVVNWWSLDHVMFLFVSQVTWKKCCNFVIFVCVGGGGDK